jgi:RHS repeat-associated protein
MSQPHRRTRVRAFLGIALAVGGWFGCSSTEEPEIGSKPVATSREALEPGWNPNNGLNPAPIAWYVASPTDVVLQGNGVAEWSDRTTNNNDATQTFEFGRASYNPSGWNGTKPTLTFGANSLLRIESWNGMPGGTNSGFSVLAVMRSAQPQDATVLGWWDQNGGGSVWASVRKAGVAPTEQTLLDFARVSDLTHSQLLAGNQDLGTIGRAVVWRYNPANQTLTHSVDGKLQSSPVLAQIGALPTAMPLLIGVKTLLPTGQFRGDISELVIVPGAVSDADIQEFTEYAQLNWNTPATNNAGPCFDATGQPSPFTFRCDDGNPATQGDHCSTGGTCVGTTPPAGSPAELSPRVWFHANDQEVVITEGRVSTWFDRSPNRLNVLQSHSSSRPEFLPTGWNGNKPTLRFNGGNVLAHEAWTGSPMGTSTEFTVLAVVKPADSRVSGIASWWSDGAYGRVVVGTSNATGPNLLNIFRQDDANVTQAYTGTTDLGTSRHAVAWRYSPWATKLTIDGTTIQSSGTGTSSLGVVNLKTFLVGASNHIANALFHGDISELAVIPTSITDTAVRSFTSYAQNEWGGLTLCSATCVGKACGADDGCGGICECLETACDPSAPFNPPVPAFTGTTIADGLTFSRDGLTAYVSGKASSTNYDIYTATRPLLSNNFSALSKVEILSSAADDRAPSLSQDGLRLYLGRFVGNSFDLALATRSASNIQFSSAPQALSPFNVSSYHDQDPFLLEGSNQLYFASENPSFAVGTPDGKRHLYVASISNGFASPTPLSVNFPGEDDFRPVVSPDGTILYFASTRPGIGTDSDGDIWLSKRNASSQPFGQPTVGATTNLYGLNTSNNEFPVAISSNACTLYFASNRDTGNGQDFRLYQATRGSTVPTSVTTTLKIVGAGSVTTPAFQCSSTCTFQGPPEATAALTATSLALWTGSCTSYGGNPSSDGVFVYTNGGTCTVTFPTGSPGGPGTGCEGPTWCQSGVCTNGTCQCPPGAACSELCPCGPDGICTENNQCGAGLECEEGQCRPVGEGGDSCEDDLDCAAGFVCGNNNGACFGGRRADKVCWPATCADGVTPDECGQPGSICGQNCECVVSCEPANPTCPGDDQCKPLGGLFDASTTDVCVDPRCPSNDPAYCGPDDSLCGPCICTPDCSDATCEDPGDGCDGTCPGVCEFNEETSDEGACLSGGVAVGRPDNLKVCRPAICDVSVLKPPLCGPPPAPCGECPVCVPDCDGRECGADLKCGQSCGSCSTGEYCDFTGQCMTPSAQPRPVIPDGVGGTRQLEPLPDAPASGVGALAGRFSVTEQGTADYTIPIEVPPGPGGMEPAISIRYSGSRAATDIGTGWYLDGLSKITRCPRVHALDGYAAPIANNSTDRFCLDGKRLFAVPNAQGVQGEYGRNGTEYRTTIDSFAKIISYQADGPGLQPDNLPDLPRAEQGPDYFKVWTKDGRVLVFGLQQDTLVIAQNGVRHSWLLHYIEDRSQNRIYYHHTNYGTLLADVGTSTRSVHRLSSISYSGRGVLFEYEPRQDPAVTFQQGGLASIVNERLKKITTLVSGRAIRNYRLNYASGEVSQLESVTECEASLDLVCKRPTTFEYNHEVGFVQGPNALPILGAVQLDANGDGIPDFGKTKITATPAAANPEMEAVEVAAGVAVGVGTSFLTGGVGLMVSAFWSFGSPLFFDAFRRPTIKFESQVLFGTGQRSTPFRPEHSFGLPCSPGSTSYLLDYDRDGLDDVAGICSGTSAGDTTWLRVSRSLGYGGFELVNPNVGHVIDLPMRTGGTTLLVPEPAIYDVDGDSLQDIVSCRDEYTLEFRRRISPTEGFASEPVAIQTDVPLGTTPRDWMKFCDTRPPRYNIFDIDGDGTPELVVHHGLGWYALRYSRTAMGETLSWQPLVFEGAGAQELDHLILGDFNGDGLMDVSKRRGHWLYLWINTGNGSFIRRPLAVPSFVPSETSQVRRRAAIMDYSADGRVDIIESFHSISNGANHNFALTPDSMLGELSAEQPLGLRFTYNNDQGQQISEPATFKAMGDVDADGNPDLLGEAVHYGAGRRNNLLSKVTDGLGRIIGVTYDGDGTYVSTCSGATWPEMCLKRMGTLVSQHSESYLDNSGAGRSERSYYYKYENGRISTTGHGWLGFDARTITMTSIDGPASTTRIEYEPVRRHSLHQSPPSGVSVCPTLEGQSAAYAYPLAGLVKSVTTDQRVVGLRTDPLPLEDRLWERRTKVTNGWGIDLSASCLPFAKLEQRFTRNYDREARGVFDEPLPQNDNGLSLGGVAEHFVRDRYNNVTELTRYDDLGEMTIETPVTVDRETWTISNPDSMSIVASIFGAPDKTQTWDFDYDARGRLEVVTREPFGSNLVKRHTKYVRNDRGNVWQIIEAEGGWTNPRTTVIDYDGWGVFPRFVTNPMGHKTEFTFDERFGTIKDIVDPNGVATQHVYDGLGLLSETRNTSGREVLVYDYIEPSAALGLTNAGVIQPRMSVTAYRESAAGLPGSWTRTELDHHGRPVRSRSPGFGGVELIEERVYDATGRLVGEVSPHPEGTLSPATVYYYDNLDRLLRAEHSDGTAAERHYATRNTLKSDLNYWLPVCGEGYCPRELITLSVDQEQKKDLIMTDPQGRVLRNIDGRNIDTADAVTDSVTDYRYDAFGHLRRILHAGGASAGTTFDYDGYGRLITHTAPETGTTTNTYNGFDELDTSLDGNLYLRNLDYDALGRLTTISDPTFGVSEWIYDGNGNGDNALGRISETRSPGTPEYPAGQRVVYTYEPPTAAINRGNLKQVDYVLDGTTYEVGFQYDSFGRTNRIDYPNAAGGPSMWVRYEYTPQGILRDVEAIVGGSTQDIWRLDEVEKGYLLERETFGSEVAVAEYQYFDAQHLLKSVETKLLGEPIQRLDYEYLDNGLVSKRTFNGTQRNYNYDSLNRLSAFADVTSSGIPRTSGYDYDYLGNLTQLDGRTVTPAPSRPRLVGTIGSNQYDYDAKGNLTSRSGPNIPGAGVQTIAYTPFDLPRRIVTTDSSGSARTSLFEYSADEERLIRRDPSSRNRYFVDELYQRVIDSGTTTEERFRIFAGDRLVAEIVREGGAERTLFFHQDHQGSVSTISTTTGQSFTQEFDPFGAPFGSDTLEQTRAGFTGHQHDDDIGFIDMRGRLYDPLAARFVSADPIMQEPFWSQGTNRYSYVFNDPVNNTDPSGFLTIAPGHYGGAYFVGTPLDVAGNLGGIGIDIAMPLVRDLIGWGGNRGVPLGTTQVGMGKHAPTSVPSSQGATNATQQNKGVGPQRVIDEEYRRLGLRFPHAPRFDPRMPVEPYPQRGDTEPNTGQVKLGRAAVGRRSITRSTLIHEQKHLSQVAESNIAKNPRGVAEDVNEAEALREELLQYQRSGLSGAEQEYIAEDYKRVLEKIGSHSRFGDVYLRRILIEQNFQLLPGHAFSGPSPNWTSTWTSR